VAVYWLYWLQGLHRSMGSPDGRVGIAHKVIDSTARAFLL